MEESKTRTILVYTQNGAIPFQVKAPMEDFTERLGRALEQGTVVLETAQGGTLLLSAINVVAIEICEDISDLVEFYDETPPHAEKSGVVFMNRV